MSSLRGVKNDAVLLDVFRMFPEAAGQRLHRDGYVGLLQHIRESKPADHA